MQLTAAKLAAAEAIDARSGAASSAADELVAQRLRVEYAVVAVGTALRRGASPASACFEPRESQ